MAERLHSWYNVLEMSEEGTSLEERMARVEGILEENRTRLNHLETRMDSLENRMAAEFRELRQEMRSQFRWTLGILIPMWVTIILTILFYFPR